MSSPLYEWSDEERNEYILDLLKRKGVLALEIGFNQYKKVSRILRQNGYREMSKENDNNQNVRCIISTKVNFF